ncbi:S66 peptidase family protein [Paenisporosarcina sp. TG20]|uniref:S66 family peptidase n=1 Tax=Paenisporosarcina sp. TG20 TaxID=1211706 RepID=UPI0003079CF3|nr:S66 peptidase family protein [Paenisporosarcina sp. TG20]
MIRYPNALIQGQTIGITAPSSGVKRELHNLILESKKQFENHGYKIEIGETVWTQDKAESATKEKRATELNLMLQNHEIKAVIPPWGGEILQEILPLIDWDKIEPKWVLGYSDTSTLLFSLTLKTGIATAHGTNLVDLRSGVWDSTTSKFLEVLSSEEGAIIHQMSSSHYQSKWAHDKPADPYVFKLDTQSKWETVGNQSVEMNGRLLGGCMDTIHHLVGTPYGDVRDFQDKHIQNAPILWYLENCNMSATEFHRSLLQMQQAGWFDLSAGIIFGRTSAGQEVDGFTTLDALERLAEATSLPIIYNADIGHVPPQLTFVNGAYAEVKYSDGQGEMTMYLKQ